MPLFFQLEGKTPAVQLADNCLRWCGKWATSFMCSPDGRGCPPPRDELLHTAHGFRSVGSLCKRKQAGNRQTGRRNIFPEAGFHAGRLQQNIFLIRNRQPDCKEFVISAADGRRGNLFRRSPDVFAVKVAEKQPIHFTASISLIFSRHPVFSDRHDLGQSSRGKRSRSNCIGVPAGFCRFLLAWQAVDKDC